LTKGSIIPKEETGGQEGSPRKKGGERVLRKEEKELSVWEEKSFRGDEI